MRRGPQEKVDLSKQISEVTVAQEHRMLSKTDSSGDVTAEGWAEAWVKGTLVGKGIG